MRFTNLLVGVTEAERVNDPNDRQLEMDVQLHELAYLMDVLVLH